MSTIFRDAMRVAGLEFNTVLADEHGSLYSVDLLDGWDDTAEPNVILSNYSQNEGAVAARRFPVKEKYVEIGGYVESPSRLAAEYAKIRLQGAFEPNTEFTAVREGPIPQAMLVRVSSSFQVVQDIGTAFRWVARLVAAWPYKFSPTIQEMVAGVFTGEEYYRTYDETFSRYYDEDSSRVYFPDTTSFSTTGTVVHRNHVLNPIGNGVVGDVELRRNLVRNPSGEGSTTTGWTLTTLGGTPGTGILDNISDTTDGERRAFRLRINNLGTGTGNGHGAYTDVAAAPGDVMAIQGKLKAGVYTATGATVQISAEWRSGTAALGGAATLSNINMSNVNWNRRFGVTNRAPVGTTTLRVYVRVLGGTVAGNVTAYFDKFLVERANWDRPFFHPGFGERIGGENIKWTGAENNSESVIAAFSLPNNMQRSSTFTPTFWYTYRTSHDEGGSYGIRWQPDTPDDTAWVGMVANGLTIGETYTFGVWVYCETGTPSVVAYASVPDARGTSTGLKNQWVMLTVTFVATSNTTAVGVRQVNNTTPLFPQPMMFMDDPTLVQGSTLPVAGTFSGYTQPRYGPDGTFYSYGWVGNPGSSHSVETRIVQVLIENPVRDTIDIMNEGNTAAETIIQITGPLPSSGWMLINETTGQEMTMRLDISSGSVLELDSREKTAMLNGRPVDYYMRGSWIKLAKGMNRLRLRSAEANADARFTLRAAHTWR